MFKYFFSLRIYAKPIFIAQNNFPCQFNVLNLHTQI